MVVIKFLPKIKEENNQLRKSAQSMSDQIANLQQKLRAHGDTSFMTSDKENQFSRNNIGKVMEKTKEGADVDKNRATLRQASAILM